jgi:MFS family permease
MDPSHSPLDSARSWVVVGAAFISTFTVFGVVYSFGAFFDSMASEFGIGRGATALMFSVTTALYFTLGLVTGRLADRFGPRPVLIFGAVALGTGLIVTSRVSSIWVGYATYGIGVGIAAACGYVPMVATVGAWFDKKRTLALGISVSGIGAGTLVFAPVSSALIEAYGWRTSYVILGVAGTTLLLVASIGAFRPHVPVGSTRVNLGQVVRNRSFLSLYAASLLASMALFVPFVFIKSYATERGIDSGLAAALVGIIGASSIIGRLGIGALGTRWGTTALMQGSFALMTLSYLLWLFADGTYLVLVAFAVVMGVGYGGFIALSPAVVATLFGTVGMATILGAVYTSAGLGGLIGPPIAGEIIDRISYPAGIIFALVMTGLGTIALLALPRASRPTPVLADAQ